MRVYTYVIFIMQKRLFSKKILSLTYRNWIFANKNIESKLFLGYRQIFTFYIIFISRRARNVEKGDENQEERRLLKNWTWKPN